NQHVSIIRIKDEVIDTKFLHYALTAKKTKNMLLEIGEQGSTRQAITKVQLENFIISFPKDVAQQKALVKEIDEIKSHTISIQQKYLHKIKNLDELKKSILQRAFAGELTKK